MGGILLVLWGWPMVGMLIQGWGFLNLFGDFFPVALTAMRNMPIIGTFLSLGPVRAVSHVARLRLHRTCPTHEVVAVRASAGHRQARVEEQPIEGACVAQQRHVGWQLLHCARRIASFPQHVIRLSDVGCRTSRR